MAGTTGITVRVISNRLPALASGLAGRVSKEAVVPTAFQIEATAKRLAPVRTGTLRRSIHTVLSNAGLTATIGPSVAYGIYVEMGTRHMGARPYLRPAFEQHIRELVPRIQAVLRAA